MNFYDSYARTPNRVYSTGAIIQKNLNYWAKYKIKLSTCTQSHTKRYAKNDNQFSILDRNCPPRTLEIVFVSIKISKFSGDGHLHTLQLNPTLFLFFKNWFCVQ